MMKHRVLSLALAFFMSMFALTTAPVRGEVSYALYGAVTIIDVSNATANEKAEVEEAARNSKVLCTIIYDGGGTSTAEEEYSLNSSVLWNGSYSREEFVEAMEAFEPYGSYQGTAGWQTFYVDYACEWYDTCTAYGINPAFMVALSCWQTGYGTSQAVTQTGDLFGMKDLREYCYENIPARSQEILKIACERYSRSECTTVGEFGECISTDPEFGSGVARLMNIVFGNLLKGGTGETATVKVVGDFSRIEFLPTYNK